MTRFQKQFNETKYNTPTLDLQIVSPQLHFHSGLYSSRTGRDIYYYIRVTDVVVYSRRSQTCLSTIYRFHHRLWLSSGISISISRNLVTHPTVNLAEFRRILDSEKAKHIASLAKLQDALTSAESSGTGAICWMIGSCSPLAGTKRV